MSTVANVSNVFMENEKSINMLATFDETKAEKVKGWNRLNETNQTWVEIAKLKNRMSHKIED